jgi:2-iminobutanoate/2-iminopropanoate deaminase
MTIQSVQTKAAPAAIGPYSQAVASGGFLFVSGTLGMDPESGALVGDGLAPQARQALSNLAAILQAGGCTPNHVVAVDVFLTDMQNFAQFNTIYSEFFQDHKPARAVVEVSALPKGACVEIKCVARRP